MGTKDNFNQAMHEVFPFYRNLRKSDAGVESDQLNIASKDSLALKHESETHKAVEFEAYRAAQQKNPDSTYAKRELEKIETTYITKDTKFKGTVVSKSNLDVSGDIFGDVESQNHIKINGKVEGNISGKEIKINGATIKGNIKASEKLFIEENSKIDGNITANEIEFNGKISGNINAIREIKIHNKSNIAGDITAASVCVEKGALIKGMLNTLSENDENGEAPDSER